MRTCATPNISEGKFHRIFVVDFAAVMERMRHIRARLSRRVSPERLSALGIDVYFGAGASRDRAPWRWMDRYYVSRRPLSQLERGRHPHPFPGLDEAGYLTHENVFDLTECPPRLLVIGGGPLGCELAQAFCRFGSQVTIVEKEPMFLSQEERDAAQILSGALERDGIDVRLNTDASQGASTRERKACRSC